MISRKTSIAVSVIAALVAISTVLLGTLGAINYLNTKERVLADARFALALDADQIIPGLSLSLWNFDHPQIDKVVEGMMLDPILQGIVVKSADNKTVICARERDAQGHSREMKKEFPAAGLMVETRAIKVADQTIATVTLFGTSSIVEGKLRQTLHRIVIDILALDLIQIVALALLLRHWVFKPLQEVEIYAATVSAGGRPVQGRNFRGELERLRSSIEKMFGLLDARYHELQESGEKFSKAFRSSPSGIAITDIETGHLIEVNESFARQYGFSIPEMVGHSTLELGIWGNLTDRERLTQPLHAHGSVRDFEVQTRTRDGGTKIILINAELIELGGRQCVVSLVQDITERKRAEEILREKQAQLILAMDIAKLAHWEFDLAKNLIMTDEKMFQMLGTTSAEAGGLSMSPEDYIRKFVHPQDANLVASEVALGVATTDPNFARQFEHRIVRHEGTEGVMLTRSRIAQGTAGQTVKIHGTCQDITEQKRAQGELIWKTAFLEAQVDSALDGILVVDDRAKRILQNQRLFQLFNIPDDIARDDDDDKLLRHVVEQTKNPERFVAVVTYLYAHPDEIGRDEIELVDGRILDRYSARVRDKAGKYYGRIWTFRDITEQKRAQEDLRATNARYVRQEAALMALTRACALRQTSIAELKREVALITAQTLEVDRVSIWRYSAKGEGIVCQELFERTKRAHSNWKVLQATDYPAYFRALAEGEVIAAHDAYGDQRTIEFSETYLRPLGITSMLDAPIHVIGSVTGVICCEHVGPARQWTTDEQTFAIAVANVVSLLLAEEERQQIERQFRQAQKMDAIGQLAGGIAHDLNNALGPIMMAVEILKMKNPDDLDMLETLENSARRAAGMVRQLLTFAKGAEGQRVSIQFLHLVKEMEKMIRGTFPKNIELKVRMAVGLPTVSGDATQLHQVLLNLCVNARDAMPHGGKLTLEVEATEVDAAFVGSLRAADAKPGHYLALRVTDTGTGIPPEIIDRIFEPFFSTKGPDKGTGLGLSTVMGIVKGHGGFLQVSSQVGRGTTFGIFLPAEKGGSQMEDESKVQPSVFRGKGETILYVDDEASMRDIARAVLSRLNFTPLTATDGADALIHAAQNRSALRAIITDLNMPHMDGLTLVRMVRRILPDLPMIIASGRMEDHQMADFKALGVHLTLNKPFTQDQMAEVLKIALENPKSSVA